MRRLPIIWILLSSISCTKSDDPATRLQRTASTDNSGNVLNTEYGYDNSGRIVSISQYKNNAAPAVAVTLSYNGNTITLASKPDTDPAYDQTSMVYLMLDANGRAQRRIENTHGVAKGVGQPTETFKYDTLLYEYDANGFLKKTTGSRYDSVWVNATYTMVTRFSSTATYTINAGNLASVDEYVTYPIITRNGGIITISGGSSEYHNVFSYKKTFANSQDFANSSVLNEFLLYYEPVINMNFKNLPEQAVRGSIDKDINGSVIFTGTSTIDIDRTYNADGLLSSVQILSQNTPYKEVKYFYVR